MHPMKTVSILLASAAFAAPAFAQTAAPADSPPAEDPSAEASPPLTPHQDDSGDIIVTGRYVRELDLLAGK